MMRIGLGRDLGRSTLGLIVKAGMAYFRGQYSRLGPTWSQGDRPVVARLSAGSWFRAQLANMVCPHQAGLAVVGVIVLLLCALASTGVPMQAQARASLGVQETPVVPLTPTPPDPTVTALQKEKAALDVEKGALDVQKAKLDIANSQHTLENWFWTGAAVLVAVVVGTGGLFRWFWERREERRKRDEERFEEVLKGLGDELEQARISAAAALPTFLGRGYERFYRQVFNLVVGNLSVRSPKPSRTRRPSPLTQVLVPLYVESYQEARDELFWGIVPFWNWIPRWGRRGVILRRWMRTSPDSDKILETGRALNATGIRLDGSYLANADLRYSWMWGASLVRCELSGARLVGAVLEKSDLSGATLVQAYCSGANLRSANLTGAKLGSATLTGADLTGAILISTNIEAAQSLKGALMEGITGLDEKQVAICKGMGAMLPDAEVTSTSTVVEQGNPVDALADALTAASPTPQIEPGQFMIKITTTVSELPPEQKVPLEIWIGKEQLWASSERDAPISDDQGRATFSATVSVARLLEALGAGSTGSEVLTQIQSGSIDRWNLGVIFRPLADQEMTRGVPAEFSFVSTLVA